MQFDGEALALPLLLLLLHPVPRKVRGASQGIVLVNVRRRGPKYIDSSILGIGPGK